MSSSPDAMPEGAPAQAPAKGSATAPAIVLVEPQLGENIGMVARAMANFQLTDLRLVSPRDGWPSEKARATASRADHVIDAARVFDSVEAAIADLQFVYATTARPREGYKPVRGPDEAALTLRGRAAAGQPTGILFGRERFGLSSEEVGLADEIVTFPVDPTFASLNIAQAVLLMSYEWTRVGREAGAAPRFVAPEAPPATKDDLHRFFAHLEASLDEANYFHPPERRDVLVANLRTMLTKAGFTEPEIRTLRGVLKSFDYRMARKTR